MNKEKLIEHIDREIEYFEEVAQIESINPEVTIGFLRDKLDVVGNSLSLIRNYVKKLPTEQKSTNTDVKKAIKQLQALEDKYHQRSDNIWDSLYFLDVNKDSVIISLAAIERIFRGFSYDLKNVRNILEGETEDEA